MNKIVCSSIDFVFLSEVNTMNEGEDPILNENGIWKKIDVFEKPVYQSNVKQNDAGPTNEETVSVEARRNNLTELLIKKCGFYTILRMRTDNEVFYVGNVNYPCKFEFTSDKVFDTYSFRAISPA